MAQNFLAAARRLATLALALAAACGGQDPPTVGGPDPDADLRLPKGSPVTVRPDARLHPLGTEEYFGQSLALSGPHLVVLDYPNWDEPATHLDAFEVANGQSTWAGVPARPDFGTSCFGRRIRLEQDLLMASDPCAAPSYVQTYRSEEGFWVPEPPIIPPPEFSAGDFGLSISSAANRLVIGAPGETLLGADGAPLWNAGAVYVYKRVDGGWRLLARLVSPAPAEWGQFGRNVAVAGDRVAATEPYRPEPGTLHLFETGATGDLVHASTLQLPEASLGEVAFCGGELVAAGMADAFRLHVLAAGAAGWSEVATIDDGGAPFEGNARFACDGTTMALSFPWHAASGLPSAGEVRIFKRGPAGWGAAMTLLGTTTDEFLGRGIAVSNGVVAIGAPGAPLGEIAPGAVILIRP